LSIDDNVIVVGYPKDLEILEDASFDDTPATVPIAHQPSNKENTDYVTEMQRICVS